MPGPPEMLEAVEGDSARPQRVPNFVEREKSRARPCSVLRPMRLQEVLGTEKMLAFYEAAWPADTPMPLKIIGKVYPIPRMVPVRRRILICRIVNELMRDDIGWRGKPELFRRCDGGVIDSVRL